MQIEEVDSSTVAKQEGSNAESREGFEFTLVPLDDPRIFGQFKSKDNQQRFFKWGLQDSIQVCKFRFNKSFHLIGAEDFLKDLFNDSTVLRSFEPLRSLEKGKCSGVKFTHLNCNVLNMSFFDIFHELKVCSKDGHIRQNYEERLEGIVMGDRLRQVMLWEEYDDPDAWDVIHEDKYQREFIFKLFQHISVGGGVCQWEDNIGEYLTCVKELYKDLVTVAKDPDT